MSEHNVPKTRPRPSREDSLIPHIGSSTLRNSAQVDESRTQHKSRARFTWPVKQSPLRGLLALVGGTAGAQLLTVVAAPVLTRLYSPASFGVFSYLFSVSAIVVSVASLRFELAIPLSKTLSEAQRLTRMAMTSAVVWASLTALVVAAFHTQLSQIANFNIMPWAIWLPFLILFTSWFVVLSQAALRQRAYGAVAARTLIQNIGTIGGQLLFATVTRSPGGLLSGQVLGRTSGIVALARTNGELLHKPVAGSYRKTFRAYRRFPFGFAPSALLNVLGAQLPLILLTMWFGIRSAGLLGVAQRVGMIPAAIIGVAVGQVFYGELTARLRAGERNNKSLYLKASSRLMLIGIVIAIALLTLPPLVFPIVFGPQWAGAAGYAQAMAPAIGIGFMVSPLDFVYEAYQRAVGSIVLDLSRVALICGLGYYAYHSGWTAIGTTWAMYAGMMANYAMMWVFGLVVVSGGNQDG
jgi:O-antigen/teichoic acid export membrane protein